MHFRIRDLQLALSYVLQPIYTLLLENSIKISKLNFILFSMKIAFILLTLLSSALSANYIYMETNTTKVDEMRSVCERSPVSNLNMCNSTCLECSVSSSYKCSACHEQFRLEGDACYLDNNIHNYSYYSYLKDLNAELMAADLQQFIYGDISTHILINKVIGICKENTYELFMAGPFKDTNVVGFNYKFVDKIDQIQIKFNFMSFVADMTLIVDINDETIFRKKFTVFSDLVGTYYRTPNNSGPNFFQLNALTASNVNSVISPVDTGVQEVISNDLRIRIYIDTAEVGYCWGFNDFVVIQRACETCVTEAVQQLMDNLISLCWAVLLIVIVLLALLFAMIKLENLQRKWEFENELGSSNSLPTKAIDRVIDSIEKSRKVMDKDSKRADKYFFKLTKRE